MPPSIMETTSKYRKPILSNSNVCTYRKSMDIYDELMKRNDYDRNIHAFKACCMYALCNYKEAKVEV